MMKKFFFFFFVLLGSVLSGRAEDVLSLDIQDETTTPPVVEGLSRKFYKNTCPALKTIVKRRINFYLKQDITQAAGLLRLHFHDCFVKGCDGSVLLAGSASEPSEQDAPPNLTLRGKALQIINDIKQHVDEACGVVVSCADIVALAARDAVAGAGGPKYRIPLGRRDSEHSATRKETMDNMPEPTSNASALLTAFSAKGLDASDLVALSGGHTMGMGHCSSFSNRLYPRQDATMNRRFAKGLYRICPSQNTINTAVLDMRTPNVFDNKYYMDLQKREALFTSDQALLTDSRTKPIVKSFALDQALFFKKFGMAMVKMGQLNVLTGSQGEIRMNCSARNPSSHISTLADVAKEMIDSAVFT